MFRSLLESITAVLPVVQMCQESRVTFEVQSIIFCFSSLTSLRLTEYLTTKYWIKNSQYNKTAKYSCLQNHKTWTDDTKFLNSLSVHHHKLIFFWGIILLIRILNQTQSVFTGRYSNFVTFHDVHLSDIKQLWTLQLTWQILYSLDKVLC